LIDLRGGSEESGTLTTEQRATWLVSFDTVFHADTDATVLTYADCWLITIVCATRMLFCAVIADHLELISMRRLNASGY
jgi:hypothetical protein